MPPFRGPWFGLVIALAVALGAALPAARAQVEQAGRRTRRPGARVVSRAPDRVNVPDGAGQELEKARVFAREGLPVQIVAEFDTWRKIEDHEGDQGWVHSSLLSSRRTIMIKDELRELRRTPSETSRVVLRAEPGVMGRLFDCVEIWCRVEISGQRGWLRRDEFWGTTPGEILR